MSKAAGRVLLPPTINPTHYALSLTPDLPAHTFAGTAVISLTTSSDVSGSEIQLHAKELCLASASYVVKGGADKREAVEIRDNKKETVVTFVFEEEIPKSAELVLAVEYSGFLNNQMAGFYRSSYTDIHGEKKIMASTQFESLDAR